MESIKKLIDRDSLRAEMARNKISREKLADLLKVSASNIDKKMAYSSDFTEEQTYILYKVFGTTIFLK